MKQLPKCQRPRRSPRRRVLTLAAVCGALWAGLAAAQSGLPQDVAHLLEAAPLPPLSIDPARRYALLVHERQLIPLDRLAEPALDLAGRRVNPRTGAAHAPLDYYGLTVVTLANGERRSIPLPRDAIVGYPSWAPDGSRFAFTVQRDGDTTLWIGEPEPARAGPLIANLHVSRGPGCSWTADSRRLLCTRLAHARSRAAAGDSLQAVAQQSFAGEPVILDEQLARRLLESQLELVDSVSRQRHAIGQPAAFESVSAAPAGAFVLVQRILEPYPRISGVDIVERAIEVWDRFGNIVTRLPSGVRAVQWHAARPATLVWVERRDDSDRLMSWAPPYSAAPETVFDLPHRFSGLRWLGSSDAALVADYAASSGVTEQWLARFGADAPPGRRLMTYASAEPRVPLMAVNAHGMEAVAVHDDQIYFSGEEIANRERRPFLDRIALADGERTRIWQAGPQGHESVVGLLSPDARRLLTRHETSSVPPNYFVSDAQGRRLRALTDYAHPAPPLIGVRSVRLEYAREDGVALAANLHLPPGHDGGARLPLVVWAYPRQVSTGAATQRAAEQARFPTFERAFRLFFLLRGYAVLDGVSMPILGDGRANDTFIEQIVANANAAIDAAASTGFVDSSRVGVAGHSYGAFMVANLLAHSKLFRAGAALSGAYNRTLTPFGFQTERRTLWEAPETYLAMSPLLFSHRIEAPLLLVHGLKDDNAGTSPLQSTQFYQAIRGNGGEVELLLLPWEGHSYRARESVLTTAAHMLDWFDRHVKADPFEAFEKETGALLRPSQ